MKLRNAARHRIYGASLGKSRKMHSHRQKRTSADLRDRTPCSIQITRFGVIADGYLDDQTAGYIGGSARAGLASGGSGTSRVWRITGGVTAGSGVASWRAGGLRAVRGRHRFELPLVRLAAGGLSDEGSTRFYGGSTR
jgi:hypothetical protein